jgi:Ser/Thr protein kinase RdoA (MazF antagonist)
MEQQPQPKPAAPAPEQGNRDQTVVLAQIIRQHYDLGEVSTPHDLPVAHQRRHRKLVVQTSVGKFLVKTYKNDPVILDALRFQHRLSDHLRAHQLPVPAILPAKNGKRIVEFQNWALELQVFIEGHPMQVTSKSLVLSAHALGKFHVVCRDFPRPERDVRMWRFSEVPRTLFGSLYEAACKEGVSDAVDACCNSIALFLRDASKELSLACRNKFETGLIHGDWHSGNLLFIQEKLVGIVDLEFAGDGCYLEDLAYAVSNLCVRTATEYARLDIRTDLLLQHYQKYRTLSPAEERALYYAVGVKHVTTVSYQTKQLDGTVAGITPVEWMKRLEKQCLWLAERAHRVKTGT